MSSAFHPSNDETINPSGNASIRDVMAFPKTQSAACLLTQAPAPVTEAQLRDLNIRLRRTP